jgi:hypothetical protein
MAKRGGSRWVTRYPKVKTPPGSCSCALGHVLEAREIEVRDWLIEDVALVQGLAPDDDRDCQPRPMSPDTGASNKPLASWTEKPASWTTSRPLPYVTVNYLLALANVDDAHESKA